LSQIETPDGRTRIGVHDGAATGREHLRAALEQARNHPGLAAAESSLAVAGKNVGNGGAGGGLDLGIGVDERHAQPDAEAAADRRFAHPHHANQNDRTGPQKGQDRRRGKRRVCIILYSYISHLQQVRD